jgi:hypothetical protein
MPTLCRGGGTFGLEPLKQLHEEIAAVAVRANVVVEVIFVDHQPRVRRERTRLLERALDVVRAESGEEDALPQAIVAVPGVDGLVHHVYSSMKG